MTHELRHLRKHDTKIFDLEEFDSEGNDLGKRTLIKQQGLHYLDDNSVFQDCNCDIVATSTEDGFDYSCEKIEFPFHVSSTGKRRIHLKRNKSQYVDLDLPFPNLGAPTISGNKLVWDKPKFAIALVATPEGCVMEILIKEKLASNSFSLPIRKLQGLTFNKLKRYLGRQPQGVDVNDKPVPITYTKESGQLVIEIDDTDATYPIRIL